MVFNLVPIPPLDGSKILFYFVKNANLEATLNRFGFMILMMIIIYGFGPIQMLTGVITKFLIGG
jgi:Zn-dependent protease